MKRSALVLPALPSRTMPSQSQAPPHRTTPGPAAPYHAYRGRSRERLVCRRASGSVKAFGAVLGGDYDAPQ